MNHKTWILIILEIVRSILIFHYNTVRHTFLSVPLITFFHTLESYLKHSLISSAITFLTHRWKSGELSCSTTAARSSTSSTRLKLAAVTGGPDSVLLSARAAGIFVERRNQQVRRLLKQKIKRNSRHRENEIYSRELWKYDWMGRLIRVVILLE